ncbi:hypothetical protein LTR37_014760 [Vermiconidia calcicola]|uniref:Uncharacterized protein n=1 Tax=Vermiconidia calcicola TaxID=1690605 RepID=A0ACC3MSJ2_9PEZI|nr:hypothetical protein LTR37_014760 [Vermiconidia calcicola]
MALWIWRPSQREVEECRMPQSSRPGAHLRDGFSTILEVGSARDTSYGRQTAATDKQTSMSTENARTDNQEAPTTSMNYPADENLFHSAPSQPLEDNTTTDPTSNAEDTAYQEPPPEQLLPLPDFQPFFTLIEEPATGEHHHPTVHYMFSDDDPEVLTSAALDALDTAEDGSAEVAQAGQIRERCVIIDMAADGKTVASASSISPDWQALKTTITQAPSLFNASENADKGLVLKISGQERTPVSISRGKSRPREQDASIDELLKKFGDRLQSLDEALGARDVDNEEALTTE